MASKRPNPASHSDPRPLTTDRRTRRPSPGHDRERPARDAPGRRRRQRQGDRGRRARMRSSGCPRCSARPAADLGRPDRPDAGPGAGGRDALVAPPADRRGRPRGQPAGQDRVDRRRRPHRPVPPRVRRSRHRRRRWTSCSGDGFLLTVHDGDWDPRTAHHLQGGIGAVLKRGPDHLLWAIADDLIDGYFPFADRIGEAIDAVQDKVVQKAVPEIARGALPAQARADPGPPRDQPGPRGVQPADQSRRRRSSARTRSSTSATSTTT